MKPSTGNAGFSRRAVCASAHTEGERTTALFSRAEAAVAAPAEASVPCFPESPLILLGFFLL